MTMNMYGMSAIQRIEDCPGSPAASAGLLARSTDDARDGAWVDLCLKAIITPEALNSWEDMQARVETYIALFKIKGWGEYAVRFTAKEIFGICNEHGGPDFVIKDAVLMLPYSDLGFEYIGHPDYGVYCKDNTFHLVEAKAGHKPVALSDKNRQAQAYGISCAEKFGLNAVTIHIVQTGSDRDNRHTKSTYKVQDMRNVKDELREIGIAASKKGALRVTGEQCTYCPAKGTWRCPESVNETQAMLIKPVPAILVATPQEQVNFVVLAKRAKKLIDLQLDALKEAVIEAPDKFPLFELKPGNKNRTFTDIEKVCMAVDEQYQVDAGTLLKAAGSLAVGKTEEAIWKAIKDKRIALGVTAPDKTETMLQIKERLSAFVEVKQNDPSLKIKGVE